MSFRRYAPSKSPSGSQGHIKSPEKLPSGVKPASPPVISTGTAALDALLSPSSGLPLSSALLVEEDGTGNYSGVILRQYVAEGVVQGDKVWVGGVGETWWRGIPGLSKQEKTGKTPDTVKELEEKMKIAWRYSVNDPKAKTSNNEQSFPDFCHVFDISEQMSFPGNAQVVFSPPPAEHGNPYQPLIYSLLSFLDSSSPSTPIRLVLPDFFNPLIYSPVGIISSIPYCTLVLSLSTSFYPRTHPLSSWVEHLCTHVIQLLPLPRSPTTATSKQQPQGLVNVYKGGLLMKEMAYRVGRRGMTMEEWSLPPLEDETPRVKQGFVIEKDVAGNLNLASNMAKRNLEF